MVVKRKRLPRALMFRMSEKLWAQLDAVTGPQSLTKARWIRTSIRHALKCEQAQAQIGQQVYSRVMRWREE